MPLSEATPLDTLLEVVKGSVLPITYERAIEDLNALRSANAELRGEVEKLRLARNVHAEHIAAHTDAAFDQRDEITRLAARVADLELMLRAALARSWHKEADWMLFGHKGGGVFGTIAVCKDDGTGLPILTDEARAAMKGTR